MRINENSIFHSHHINGEFQKRKYVHGTESFMALITQYIVFFCFINEKTAISVFSWEPWSSIKVGRNKLGIFMVKTKYSSVK